MPSEVILITGFQPYGEGDINPSAEVVKSLHGEEIAGFPIVGEVLPVALSGLQQCVDDVLSRVQPIAIVSLGLWPGEATIRLERLAVNLADFEIPDNLDMLIHDVSLDEMGPAALVSRLPLRPIEQALLDAGIPARLSSSAGNFLCNATMYTFLRRCQEIPCGFVHLPYLPAQVARLLRTVREEQRLELHQRADLASMSLSLMLDAVRIILAATVAVSCEGPAAGRARTVRS